MLKRNRINASKQGANAGSFWEKYESKIQISDGKILLIEQSNGKTLLELPSNNGLKEVRAMDKADFLQLKDKNMETIPATQYSEEISVDASKRVFIDYVTIRKHFEEVISDVRNEKNELIESNMLLILDKTNPKILHVTSINQTNIAKNTAEESLNEVEPLNTYSCVKGNRNQVVLAQLHSHPNPDEVKLDEPTNVLKSRKQAQNYLSNEDQKFATKNVCPVFAVALFQNNATYSAIRENKLAGTDSVSIYYCVYDPSNSMPNKKYNQKLYNTLQNFENFIFFALSLNKPKL